MLHAERETGIAKSANRAGHALIVLPQKVWEFASSRVRSRLDRLIAVALAAALVTAVAVLCRTVSQPLLESYGFRQAQTALTAYWFVREGFALAYQTPVVGYPWEIPFELPLFQALVAVIASITRYTLENIGRSVSFAFFLATLLPVALICRELRFGHRVFMVFGSLYLLSPQYLFWGRTFMIESAATFFAVATIAAALPLFTLKSVSFARAFSVVLLASIAAMVKVTTGLPPLMVLTGVAGAIAVKHWRSGDCRSAASVVKRALLFALPVLVASAWTHFTDVVKAANEVGALFTSSALSSWNFGDLRQRISSAILVDVVWRRSLKANAGGLLGLAVISLFFIQERRRTWLAVGASLMALFVLPLLFFTNLHIVHTYYQSATTIYLIFLLAMALTALAEYTSARLFAIIFVFVLLSSVFHFRQEYWPLARQRFTPENNGVLAVAQVLREQSVPHKPLLIYGLDWSGELPYYAERKALAMPNIYSKQDEPLINPDRYFGPVLPGGLVICGSGKAPNETAVQQFLRKQGSFREMSAASCRIFLF